MTEIERKALELVNEVAQDVRYEPDDFEEERRDVFKALCRAIEQHEQFRQEVSDAVRVLDEFIRGSEDYKRGSRTDGVHLADGRSVKFARFIITKPDPLVDAICHFSPWNITRQWEVEDYERFRAALAKRGLEIREKSE